MLQFPYEKGFDMPSFEIFLLTVMCMLSTKLKSLGFQSKKNSAIREGWHAINNREVKYFSPIVFIDLPHFSYSKKQLHPSDFRHVQKYEFFQSI